MLLIVVIIRKRVSFFMRTTTPNQCLATGLFLKTFLVDAFRSNDETNEIDSLVAWQIDLRLELLVLRVVVWMVDERRADAWYEDLVHHWLRPNHVHSLNRSHPELDGFDGCMLPLEELVLIEMPLLPNILAYVKFARLIADLELLVESRK